MRDEEQKGERWSGQAGAMKRRGIPAAGMKVKKGRNKKNPEWRYIGELRGAHQELSGRRGAVHISPGARSVRRVRQVKKWASEWWYLGRQPNLRNDGRTGALSNSRSGAGRGLS